MSRNRDMSVLPTTRAPSVRVASRSGMVDVYVLTLDNAAEGIGLVVGVFSTFDLAAEAAPESAMWRVDEYDAGVSWVADGTGDDEYAIEQVALDEVGWWYHR